MSKRCLALMAAGLAAAFMASCSAQPAAVTETATETAAADASESAEPSATAVNSTAQEDAAATESSTTLAPIDMTQWSYNADDNVYYQLGVSYCAEPVDPDYENLAVFVPGDYFEATENGDDTYTCVINQDATVGIYTPATAPVVMPVNTPGYSAMAPLTEYRSETEYTDDGFIYVHAGCRGRDSGAPAGVTDLKAAIRYLRYSSDSLPADTERLFVFGMSGGGAQSAILGASGDSSLYDVYLQQIGAVEDESDAVLGVMAWCPITSLETADAAYEWMMGNTRSGLSEDEQAISDALAAKYAEYVNSAGFTDADGNALTLDESESGIYQAGSYYDYLLDVVEDSLNTFLAETDFPYDASSSSGGGPGGGGPSGNRPDGGPPDGGQPSGAPPDRRNSDGTSTGRPSDDTASSDAGRPSDGAAGSDAGRPSDDAAGSDASSPGSSAESTRIEDVDDIRRTETTGGVSLSGTYNSAQEYVDALNADGTWVTYDAATNTATITSIADFTTAMKNASKSLGAFDQLDRGQGENELFGEDGSSSHFDADLAAILADLGLSEAADYAEDLSATDALGVSVAQRLEMYSPLYYLLESEAGYGTSQVAEFWRIRTGISQGDTALTTEVNLCLALQNNDAVESVDFATVWGQKHTEAETSGNSTENFITWVEECTASN